jgi:hypothetical protein
VAAARLVLEREPLQAARWLGLADGLHKVATQDRARADLVAREAHQRLSAEAFQVEWAAGNQISATDLDTESDLMERRLQAVPA